MKNVLLVDDDPLVLRLYQEGLSNHGLKVETAVDGVHAIQALRKSRPDVVILDLMMPRFTGVDVLKFIRGPGTLSDLPVIVLSNSYANDVARQAVALGVQKALLKVRCTPSALIEMINDVLDGNTKPVDNGYLLAVPKESPEMLKTMSALNAVDAELESESSAIKFQAKARRSLLENAPATYAALRSLCQAVTNAPNEAERGVQIQNFSRKLHFIAGAAGLAGCHQLAQMASAFEALLFELTNKQQFVTPSVLRTIASAVDFVGKLFDRVIEAETNNGAMAKALVVDDDPLSNRLVAAGLQRAQIEARCTQDPVSALHMLEETPYDLILLDIEMPSMDGFELCRRLRQLPGYLRTPVIYVSAHADFENRARSILSGGGDLISKPVFPMELAVKAVTHLLKSQMPEPVTVK
jgi:CheY-like chemotaxis protein